MSAVVEADGTVRQLDRRPEPDENVTEQSVRNPLLLTRFILRLFRDVSTMKRKWMPRHIDFRGVVSTASALSPETVYLDHNLGGPVVWWFVRVQDIGTGSLKLAEETTETTENRLALKFFFDATVTVRVEEAG